MTIGEKIKAKRNEKKITQDQLAELCGLSSKRVIYDYESGRINVSLKVLHKIAEALDCDLEISLKNKNS